MEICELCSTPIEYLDRVCPHCQQPRQTPNRWGFLILLASGVFGAYGLVLGLSVVGPLAAPLDIAVIVGFFGAMFIVEHIFRKVERYHCERTRSGVAALPSSCAGKSLVDQ
jgi:hypothetical protein